MDAALTDIEEQWVSQWLSLIERMPAPLLLMINESSADGSVGVYLPANGTKTPRHSRWISRMARHLATFPEGGAWLLSNIDGWHVGSGRPTVTSSPSYGVNGACSSHHDDYAAHYIQSVMVPYGSVPDSYECLRSFESDQGRRDARLIITG